jgi:signal transduction histidine kinase
VLHDNLETDLLHTEMQLRRERRARRLADERVERLRRMHVMTAAMAAAATPLQVARALVEHGLRILGASAGGLLMLREDGVSLESLVAVGYTRDILAAWQWIPLAAPLPAAEAVRARQPIWCGTAAASAARYPELMVSLQSVAAQALAALPLLVGTRAIGALALTFEEERVFGAEERHFATMLANQVAPVLERARAFQAWHSAGPHAMQLRRRRDERVAAASHDLKMPMTAIKMATQMLSYRLSSSERPDIHFAIRELARIEGAVTRMSTLVDELMALTSARHETTLSRTPVDLVALVRRIVAEPQSDLAAGRIRLEAEPGAMVGVWNAAQLERVFANLLDNALKYSPRDSLVRVMLSVERAGDGKWGVARIQDAGMGIPAADLARVFEPFERGGNVAGQLPGTGVGLASVRDIVEQHSGSVDVISQQNRGTTFTVRLPLT